MGESFTDVIRRLLKKKKMVDLSDYFGALVDFFRGAKEAREFLEIAKVSELEVLVY